MNLSFLFQMLKKIMFLLLCLVQIGMVIFYIYFMVPYEIRRTHKKKKKKTIHTEIQSLIMQGGALS